MKKILPAIVSIIAFVPVVAFAASGCADGVSGVICNPLGNVTTLPALVSSILTYVVKIGAVVIVFFFIYSGFLFVKAQGSVEGLKTAKNTLTNTIIGAVLILGAWLIASIVVNTVTKLQS